MIATSHMKLRVETLIGRTVGSDIMSEVADLAGEAGGEVNLLSRFFGARSFVVDAGCGQCFAMARSVNWPILSPAEIRKMKNAQPG